MLDFLVTGDQSGALWLMAAVKSPVEEPSFCGQIETHAGMITADDSIFWVIPV